MPEWFADGAPCGHGEGAVERIRQLERELAEVRSRLELAVCAFCGHEMAHTIEEMAAHVAECEKHPMRAMEETLYLTEWQLERATAEIDRSQGLAAEVEEAAVANRRGSHTSPDMGGE